VATAPLPPSRVTRAKIEVVLIAIGAIFAPLIVALIFASPFQAAVHRFQVSSSRRLPPPRYSLWFSGTGAAQPVFAAARHRPGLATFAEAFSSIGWAATAALALSIPIAALATGLMTACILAAAWKISPRRE